MGAFNSQKILPVSSSLVPLIAEQITNDFRNNGFEVINETSITGSVNIRIKKKNFLRTLTALDYKLDVTLTPLPPSGVDIQARSNNTWKAIVYFIIINVLAFSVVLAPFCCFCCITFIIGLVKQAKLDDKAMAVADMAVLLNARTQVGVQQPSFQPAAQINPTVFCTSCGKNVPADNKFCPNCGAAL